MRILQQIIGRSKCDGSSDLLPMRGMKAKEQAIQDLRMSGHMVQLHVRPREELNEMPEEMRAICAPLLSKIEAGESIGVTMGTKLGGSARDFSRRTIHVTRQFPSTEPFVLSVDEALSLLGREPYKFVFDEVDDGEARPGIPSAAKRIPLPPKPRK